MYSQPLLELPLQGQCTYNLNFQKGNPSSKIQSSDNVAWLVNRHTNESTGLYKPSQRTTHSYLLVEGRPLQDPSPPLSGVGQRTDMTCAFSVVLSAT